MARGAFVTGSYCISSQNALIPAAAAAAIRDEVPEELRKVFAHIRGIGPRPSPSDRIFIHGLSARHKHFT